MSLFVDPNCSLGLRHNFHCNYISDLESSFEDGVGICSQKNIKVNIWFYYDLGALQDPVINCGAHPEKFPYSKKIDVFSHEKNGDTRSKLILLRAECGQLGCAGQLGHIQWW
jgi:hypothetical protein